MFRRNGGFRGGSRRPSFDLPKPVEVGKEYEVEISEVGSKGDGIARKDNFVIFIPNTKQGEKVKVRINNVGRSFAVGEKVSADAVSADVASDAVVAEESPEEDGKELPEEAENTVTDDETKEEEN